MSHHSTKGRVLRSTLATLLLSAGALSAHAGEANLQGLQTADSFDRFIIKYRADAAERKDPSTRQASLDRAAAAVIAGQGSWSRSSTSAPWRWAPTSWLPTAS